MINNILKLTEYGYQVEFSYIDDVYYVMLWVNLDAGGLELIYGERYTDKDNIQEKIEKILQKWIDDYEKC